MCSPAAPPVGNFACVFSIESAAGLIPMRFGQLGVPSLEPCNQFAEVLTRCRAPLARALASTKHSLQVN